MRFWASLISTNGQISSNNFTLILSAIVSSVVGICVCFVLCWDVVHNNYVKTDMESMGIFMLCMGGYLAGGSVSKVFQMRRKGRRVEPYMEEMGENGNDDCYDNNDDTICGTSRKCKNCECDD